MYPRAMRIMNRRNAVLGWATWTVFKRFFKRKAKAEAEVVAEGTKRRFRRGKEQVAEVAEPVRKRWPSNRLLAFLAAVGVGIAAWLTRRRRGSAPVE